MEIMRILSLGDLIADVKSIIILADDNGDTIMKAHKGVHGVQFGVARKAAGVQTGGIMAFRHG